MWAEAQIVPFTLLVNRGTVTRFEFVVNDFNFVGVVNKMFSQTCLVEFNALNREVSACQFLHLLLNGFQIAFCDRFHGEVVVEPSVNRRAYGRQSARVEFHHRLRKEVSGRMTENVDALF